MDDSRDPITRAARDKTERCPAIKKNGSRCTARAVAGGFCIGHRPEAEEARRMGGTASSNANRARKLLPSRLQPVAEAMEIALTEVHTGKITPAQATAMASVASIYLKLHTVVDFEERIKKLEDDDESD